KEDSLSERLVGHYHQRSHDQDDAFPYRHSPHVGLSHVQAPPSPFLRDDSEGHNRSCHLKDIKNDDICQRCSGELFDDSASQTLVPPLFTNTCSYGFLPFPAKLSLESFVSESSQLHPSPIIPISVSPSIVWLVERMSGCIWELSVEDMLCWQEFKHFMEWKERCRTRKEETSISLDPLIPISCIDLFSFPAPIFSITTQSDPHQEQFVVIVCECGSIWKLNVQKRIFKCIVKCDVVQCCCASFRSAFPGKIPKDCISRKHGHSIESKGKNKNPSKSKLCSIPYSRKYQIISPILCENTVSKDKKASQKHHFVILLSNNKNLMKLRMDGLMTLYLKLPDQMSIHSSSMGQSDLLALRSPCHILTMSKGRIGCWCIDSKLIFWTSGDDISQVSIPSQGSLEFTSQIHPGSNSCSSQKNTFICFDSSRMQWRLICLEEVFPSILPHNPTKSHDED
ncbi:hypothetical protein ADUPG1_006979, partial [Aduncisulcus paluster]